MAFVRTKEIPKGSGNFYDYRVRSVREGNKVIQEHLEYLGPSQRTLNKLQRLEKRRYILHKRLEVDTHSTDYMKDFEQQENEEVTDRNKRIVNKNYDEYKQRKKDREELQQVEAEIGTIKGKG